MTLLMILLGILAVAAIVVTIAAMHSDGYRRSPTAAIFRQGDPERWR